MTMLGDRKTELLDQMTPNPSASFEVLQEYVLAYLPFEYKHTFHICLHCSWMRLCDYDATQIMHFYLIRK